MISMLLVFIEEVLLDIKNNIHQTFIVKRYF